VHYIDFERGRTVAGKKSQQRTASYLAFVLCPGREPVRVELGEERGIKEAWDKWHEAIVTGRPDRDAALSLSRLIWQPVHEKFPTGTRAVWLVPDGLLTQVPWAALPGTQPDRVLLEDLAVVLAPHGPRLLEQLAAPTESGEREGKMLVVGDVDYDRS